MTDLSKLNKATLARNQADWMAGKGEVE